MKQVLIRPMEAERDLASFLAIRNQGDPDQVARAQWLEAALRRRPESFAVELLAEEDDRVVGVGWLRDHDLYEGGLLGLIKVDRGSRGHGIGTALAARLTQSIGEREPVGIEAGVADDDPSSRAWAERRGFRLHDHRFNSQLDLAAFDPARHRYEMEALQGAGLRFEWPGDEDRLFGLYRELFQDSPDEFDPPSREFYDAHLARPEVVKVVACDADEWVGIALLEPVRPDGAYNAFTGVRPAYRGRGIARALKVLLIERARAEGVAWIRTSNNARNHAMLAVNEALGYRRLRGRWVLRKPFKPLAGGAGGEARTSGAATSHGS